MLHLKHLILFVLGNAYVCCGNPASSIYSASKMKFRNANYTLIGNDKHIENAVVQASTRRSTFFTSPEHSLYPFVTRRNDITQIADELIPSSASDGFYPSLLRNSRHYMLPSDEDRFKSIAIRGKLTEQSVLGSGDFGVLKGGTFYQASEQPIKTYNEFFGINLKSHNGHQRPFATPLRQNIHYPSESDPFSNFRDFADINISNDGGQYSEVHVAFSNNENNITSKLDNVVVKAKKKEIKTKYSKMNETKLKLAKMKQFQSGLYYLKKMPNNDQSTINSESDVMLAVS